MQFHVPKQYFTCELFQFHMWNENFIRDVNFHTRFFSISYLKSKFRTAGFHMLNFEPVHFTCLQYNRRLWWRTLPLNTDVQEKHYSEAFVEKQLTAPPNPFKPEANEGEAGETRIATFAHTKDTSEKISRILRWYGIKVAGRPDPIWA